MKYTAKDVSRIFNINRETLRYYENMNLIFPEVDEQNGYRYYDDWDLNYIGECKRYRSLGFNIREIKEIFQKDDMADFVQKVETKQQFYLEQQKFYQMLAEKNAQYIEILKSIPKHLNSCSVIEMEERYFIPSRKNFDYSCSFEKHSIIHQLMDYFAFIEATVLVKKRDYEEKNESFMWGFSITKDLAETFQLSIDKMVFLKKRQVVYTIIDAGERWNFKYSLFDYMFDYMKDNHLKMDGNIYGNLLTRVTQQKSLHRYIEVYCPVCSIMQNTERA